MFAHSLLQNAILIIAYLLTSSIALSVYIYSMYFFFCCRYFVEGKKQDWKVTTLDLVSSLVLIEVRYHCPLWNCKRLIFRTVDFRKGFLQTIFLGRRRD